MHDTVGSAVPKSEWVSVTGYRRARAESQTATNKSQTAAEPDCRSSAVWLLVVAVWLMFKEPDCNSQENRPQNRARLQHLAAVWLFLQSGSGFWLFLQSGYTTRVVGRGLCIFFDRKKCRMICEARRTQRASKRIRKIDSKNFRRSILRNDRIKAL